MTQGALAYHTQKFEFFSPTRIVFGLQSLGRIDSYLAGLDSKRVMIVCGKNFRKTENFQKVADSLGSHLVGTFDSVTPHPTLDLCEEAGREAAKLEIDTVVSVGGGSSIDVGKAATLLREGSTKLRDYLVTFDVSKGRQVKQFQGKAYRHIAIPTTFSSAEANGSAAVVEADTRRKLILWSDSSLPSAIFLDPELVASLPRELMAASGMNTLAHCMETMYSRDLQPISEALAIGSLELIKDNLPACISATHQDIEALGMMQIASAMAGFAYGNAVVSLHHAICHVLGARFNVHHGIANSVMITYVLRDMMDHIPGQIATIGYKIGIVPLGTNPREAAISVVKWVE
ncbi:MAG: iron-containing alcohol dehydrogenase family protein, partial [Nitrososphaerales archaeon]